ncbi:magnesium/cobalt transporter CorA [Winogradskyella tangerina]|uniref:magnesium/cobalt transporter CorA n=1 Tax=Winogradskyella tangerina TaxID=2023240 RepID=UPI000DBE4517|nr:magnesium/cobalt transporter CorA [Winogradskyella tangerina]
MARFIKDRSDTKGLAPGTLVFIGTQKMESPIVQVMDYDKKKLIEKDLSSVSEIEPNITQEGVTWLNICGLHEIQLIKEFGDIFTIPPLLLEDILNTDQRPTFECYDNFDVFIIKMIRFDESKKIIIAEQITLILGKHFVVTIQERKGDVFEPVRERIRNNKGRVRLNDNDYLVYALMDAIADNYTIAIETLGRRIDELEDRIFKTQEKGLAQEIYNLKTELNYLRKTVRPVKDVIIGYLKSESTLFQEKNKVFLQDLSDLVTMSSEAIELYNNLVSDQLNIYNTNMSNSLNNVMKVLTIFASIFIPLTFLAGIYGMNFKYIPELEYPYAYPIFWVLVILIGGGLLIYFKRKKWL